MGLLAYDKDREVKRKRERERDIETMAIDRDGEREGTRKEPTLAAALNVGRGPGLHAEERGYASATCRVLRESIRMLYA